MGKDALQTLVARLKKAGLVGIEAVYSTYSPREEREMKRLAEKNELLISGGSDFTERASPDWKWPPAMENFRFPPIFWRHCD